MGLFDSVKEPLFLKESSSAQKQLEALKLIRQQAASEQLKQKLEQEIKIVEAGIFGEQQIMFELKNSHLPMAVMHDLFFEKDGLTAQIDYLIVTRKRIFILECKNMIGNIDIDRDGNFTRTISFGKAYQKEGIYSPITQNQRHLELIKRVRMEGKSNILAKSLFEKHFYENYRSVVVLANPKTVLTAKYAKKEIKNQVIRADQLIAYMKDSNAEKDAVAVTEKEMLSLADFFMNRSKENPTDYVEKYRELLALETEEETVPKECDQPKEDQVLCPKCGAAMIKRTANKGSNTGKSFYGCSNFPKCRGIININ